MVSGDARFAYSADTGPSQEIVSLAQDADVFLCEATWPRSDARASNHLSWREAGTYAQAADVGSLLLTHLWPTFDRDRAAEEAAVTFGGEIAVARSGLTVGIGEAR